MQREVAAISQTLGSPLAVPPGADAQGHPAGRTGETAGDAFLRSLREGVERSVGTVSLLEELCSLGELPPEPPAGPVDMAESFAGVHRFRLPDLQAKDLALEDGSGAAPAVLATPRTLERTLDRCLQSVIECSPEGSRILVAGRAEQDGAGAWSVLDLVSDPPEGAAARYAWARMADGDICVESPQGSLVFQIARRRARTLGGEFRLLGAPGDAPGPDGDGAVTFRLSLPAAPTR